MNKDKAFLILWILISLGSGLVGYGLHGDFQHFALGSGIGLLAPLILFLLAAMG